MQAGSRRQSGQAIVEFAIIFPFFIMMLMGFFYISLLCHDYLTLTEMARASARTAAIGTLSDADIRTYYGQQGFFTSVYSLNPHSDVDFKIERKAETTAAGSGKMVVVTLTARRAIGVLHIMGMELSLPETMQASLAMHKEE